MLTSLVGLSARSEQPPGGAALRLARWARRPKVGPPWPFGVLGFLAARLRGSPFGDHGFQRPHRLAVKTPRRSRDDPGSTPGVGIILRVPLVALLFRAAGPADATARGPKTVCPSGQRGWTQVPLAQAAWAQIPQVSCFCCPASGEICSAARAQTAPGCLEPVWPSGLRHWLQAPVSKGVVSNPATFIRVGVALVSPRPATFFRSRQPRQQFGRVVYGAGSRRQSARAWDHTPELPLALLWLALGARAAPSDVNDPGRTRTRNPRIHRPMPYPLGQGAAAHDWRFAVALGRAACCIRG